MPKSKKFREIEFHECFAVEETIITKASRNTGIHSKVIQFHDFFFHNFHSMCSVYLYL